YSNLIDKKEIEKMNKEDLEKVLNICELIVTAQNDKKEKKGIYTRIKNKINSFRKRHPKISKAIKYTAIFALGAGIIFGSMYYIPIISQHPTYLINGDYEPNGDGSVSVSIPEIKESFTIIEYVSNFESSQSLLHVLEGHANWTIEPINNVSYVNPNIGNGSAVIYQGFEDDHIWEWIASGVKVDHRVGEESDTTLDVVIDLHPSDVLKLEKSLENFLENITNEKTEIDLQPEIIKQHFNNSDVIIDSRNVYKLDLHLKFKADSGEEVREILSKLSANGFNIPEEDIRIEEFNTDYNKVNNMIANAKIVSYKQLPIDASLSKNETMTLSILLNHGEFKPFYFPFDKDLKWLEKHKDELNNMSLQETLEYLNSYVGNELTYEDSIVYSKLFCKLFNKAKDYNPEIKYVYSFPIKSSHPASGHWYVGLISIADNGIYVSFVDPAWSDKLVVDGYLHPFTFNSFDGVDNQHYLDVEYSTQLKDKMDSRRIIFMAETYPQIMGLCLAPYVLRKMISTKETTARTRSLQPIDYRNVIKIKGGGNNEKERI
ncbi:hypothetical protein J7L81_05295, partial [Candidatus Aerophobetes bacterium]|nr:hypothetical protein [Candidatus Aerophobetes bacterium]